MAITTPLRITSSLLRNCEEVDHKSGYETSSVLLCGSDSAIPFSHKISENKFSVQSESVLCDGMQPGKLVQTHVLYDESFGYVSQIRGCGKGKDLQKGIRLHEDVQKKGLLDKCSDALISMYAKCGALGKARELLRSQKSRNVFSWTSLITGYAQHGQSENALKVFEQMQEEGVEPDAMTYACVLKVCGTLRALQHGEKVHDQLVEAGFLEDNIVLCNILLDMYVKCGAIVKAHRTLQELPSRDVVSWNTLIAGYTRLGHDERALSCFDMMQHQGIFPTAMTFASVLKACGSMKAISRGEQIHHEIARYRLLDKDIVLGNALVDMYVKCGALLKAQEVLKNLPSRDVITWSTLISGYAQVGQADQALACFREMQLEGLSPNAVTYACVLKACGAIGDIEQGEKIHEDVMQQGLLKYSEVLGTALVDMYAKCGLLSKAKYVHDKLPSRSVGSWTALIAVYAQLAQGEQALRCFEQMQHEGLQPNSLTFASALKACGTIGAIDKGEQIHDEISRQGLLGSDVALGNALVDMYIKCGALLKAQKVFETLSARNVATWNTLITGFAQVGQRDYVLNCLQLMQHEGIHPNASTLSCMLNACRFRGLVDDAYIYFMNMSTNYGVRPHLEHYISMVNSFGNAGHLDKAFNIIQGMPCSDYPEVWLAFLGACQKWKDISFGRWAFEQLIQLNKNDATAYIIMINIYSATGMQDEAIMIENMMNENNAYYRH